MQNEVIEYVKQYAMITLSISIMSVGVYFFKFPNNFVFGGVTGMAALICLSTVFTKQHSVIDVACGLAVAFVWLPVVYRPARALH